MQMSKLVHFLEDTFVDDLTTSMAIGRFSGGHTLVFAAFLGFGNFKKL